MTKLGIGKKSTTSSEFAQKLRVLRISKNLSQEQLGKLIGIHYTHIGRYERGLSEPSATTLKLLAEALGVTSDYFLDSTISQEKAETSFQDKELLRMFQDLEKSPEEDKLVVKKLLEAFLLKRQIITMAIQS